METLSLRVKYRPLRIGWCVKRSDFDGLKKAFNLTHTMWGGRFNPIIPGDDFELGKQFVKLFRVDTLIPISNDETVDSFIKRFTYLPRPFIHQNLFLRDHDGRSDAVVLDVYHPIRRIFEEQVRNNPEPSVCMTFYEWAENDPLEYVFAATYGCLSSGEDTAINYRRTAEEYLPVKKRQISANEVLQKSTLEETSPNWLCSYGLNRHYSIGNSWGWPGFYIGNARDFDDLVNFWNLRAADIDLLFYDPNYPDHFRDVRDEYLRKLRSRPKGRFPPDNYIAIWTKKDNNDFDKSGFGDGLSSCTASPTIWNGGNVTVPIMCFEEKSTLANVSEHSDGVSVAFSLPEKPCYDDNTCLFQHLVASITFGVGLRTNKSLTIKTPFIQLLNEYYGRNLYFQYDKTRVEPDGIGIVIQTSDSDLRMSALRVPELISKVFEIAGMKASPSKAGLIAKRLISQLGGLQGCRVLKINGVRRLIEKYKPDQSFTRKAALQIIGEKGQEPGSPNFSEYEELYIEPRPHGSKLKPGDAHAYLVKKEVLRVGLRFECPNCRLNFWSSLDDTKTKTKCEYCGSEFDVTIQLKDRDWQYRRSGLFGKDDSQEGSIPVAMVLQQLDTAFSFNEMLYSTAIEIEPLNNSIKKCELDFISLIQKGSKSQVEIAIGECKNRGRIEQDDVKKIKAVAKSLEDLGIKVFVIFAKLSDFSEEELKICKTLNEEYLYRLILFTNRELEPYHLYEKTSQDFSIGRYQYAMTFEDMASVTNIVYFENK